MYFFLTPPPHPGQTKINIGTPPPHPRKKPTCHYLSTHEPKNFTIYMVVLVLSLQSSYKHLQMSKPWQSSSYTNIQTTAFDTT